MSRRCMRPAVAAHLALLGLAACSLDSGAPRDPDPVLIRARALQALVCVQLERVPAEWKAEVTLGWPSPDLAWRTLSEQPLVDHGRTISSVYRRQTGQLYLVVQGGFPEVVDTYGPLPQAPQCKDSKDTRDSKGSPGTYSTD